MLIRSAAAIVASLFLFQPPALADSPPDAAGEVPMYAMSLIGTPYKYGGKNPETGLDCSGFVAHVYKQTAGLQLPASSREISLHGQPLPADELRPGDLVFFNTLNRAYSHVGIYLGENRFVHSTSSATGSVTISNMNERYWASRFDGARRLLEPPSDPHADTLALADQAPGR